VVREVHNKQTDAGRAAASVSAGCSFPCLIQTATGTFRDAWHDRHCKVDAEMAKANMCRGRGGGGACVEPVHPLVTTALWQLAVQLAA
jgi:hypothetical protein